MAIKASGSGITFGQVMAHISESFVNLNLRMLSVLSTFPEHCGW